MTDKPKILKLFCIWCGKVFERRLTTAGRRRTGSFRIRPSDSITCSKTCSKAYSYKRLVANSNPHIQPKIAQPTPLETNPKSFMGGVSW